MIRADGLVRTCCVYIWGFQSSNSTAVHVLRKWICVVGYAGIRVDDFKLVLGWPGVPDSWCWPNQNSSAGKALRNDSATPEEVPCRHGNALADEHGRCAVDLAKTHDVEGSRMPRHTDDLRTNQECAPPPGEESAACCFRGEGNPDLRHFDATNASACCGPCTADEKCVGYTYNLGEGTCFLKSATAHCTPRGECTSAVVPGRTPPPAPAPAPYPGPLTCGYTGKVPPAELRTKPMLFNLQTDPGERTDLAASQPAKVQELMAKLQLYIDSAVAPLNEFSCSTKKGPGCRGVDADAVKARDAANSWVVWH
jgi:hypothetical protein